MDGGKLTNLGLQFNKLIGVSHGDVGRTVSTVNGNCQRTLSVVLGCAKQIGIELVDLTEDELKSLIYDETIHEYDCEMLEYKYAIENKWHDETEKFETLKEAKEKLAEYEETDKEEGNFEEDYYRIIDLATGKAVE